jgi:predicted deacylase
MKAQVSVGGVSAGPGSVGRGYLSITTNPPVEVPLMVVNGTNAGPTLVVTAGIHGTEYPGIEAARRFGVEIDPKALSGQIVISHLANPNAFYRRSITLSGFENQNLNWTFPGREEGTSTERLAHTLFDTLIRKADLYVDLHGGNMIEALTPYVAYADTPADSAQMEIAKKMALAYGIKYICIGDTPGSTYVNAAQLGIPSLLAEAGGQGLVSEQDVQILLAGLNNIARAFKMAPGYPAAPPRYVWVRQSVSVRASTGGFYYPCVRLEEKVDKGQRLGHITDAFGDPTGEIVAPLSGFVRWIVTSLAVNRGDPLLSISVPNDL